MLPSPARGDIVLGDDRNHPFWSPPPKGREPQTTLHRDLKIAETRAVSRSFPSLRDSGSRTGATRGLLGGSVLRRACRLRFRLRIEEPRAATEMAGPIVAETGLAARAGIPRQREQQQRHKKQERSHGPMDTGDVPPQQDRSSPSPPNSGCVASATSRPAYTPHLKAPILMGRPWRPSGANLSTSLPTFSPTNPPPKYPPPTI